MTQTQSSLLDQPLGELATQMAGSTAIFRQYKLDFCCGGHQTLGNALQLKNIAPEPVLEQLQALVTTQETDWNPADKAGLTNYIFENFHQKHRRQLPELIRLARRVEAVHGERPECPVGLADHLQTMQQELESHMMKEEQILFPILKRGLFAEAQGPIRVMEMEHDQHGDALQALLDLTNDITPPVNACNTWRALYAGLDEFRTDLMEHIHLENNVLFKPV